MIAIAVIFCIETYCLFQFYSREPEFPTRIFSIDVVNVLVRNLLLVSILMFLGKRISWVKQAAKEYCPIMIAAVLWICISMIIIQSLRLNVNAKTILSVLTGMINNSIFILLAGYIYTKRSNTLSKSLYFLAYFFTILIFYSDTVYFFVTSTHIEKMVFDNLNSYSIAGVLYTADKMVLLGILISFILLIVLFRTPKKILHLHSQNIGVIILICIAANLVDISTAHIYPKVLLASGFDEEAEIEKSRNLSRDLLSQSVAVNLVRQLLRDDEIQAAANHRYRVEFSEPETQLLNEFGIKVEKEPGSSQISFPYEKIVVLVAESFHRDYLHFYNSRIPAETTSFYDDLLAKYPHIDHYYTANKPTTQGLNSMFLSQAIYSEEQSFDHNVTLFKTLENSGYDTVFLEATSQYYNDEFRAYKKRFGMRTYRAKEDLEKQGYIGSTGWGFHNDVMYEETLRLLDENRNNKIFIVTKTIDSHQPYPYCGISNEDIPAAVVEQYNLYLKAIYWENMTLQKFFNDLKKRDLMDDKTLIIVTSDHNPHPSQDDNYTRLGKDDLRFSIAPIPLIFISTNLKPFENLSSATYASQIDFAPTLLGILGIPSPLQFSGRNMINTPADHSYAIGFLGETIYYWSKNRQIQTDMYSGTTQNVYEKALIHWMQDVYVRYFQGNSVNSVQ